MSQRTPARIVVYDGECGFCTRSIRILKSLDWLDRLDWCSRTEPGLLERFPVLSTQDTRSRMVSLTPEGKAYGGFFAVRDIWIHLPLTFLPALLFYIPGASLLGVPAYGWISKNRYRFGGRVSCDISRKTG